MAAGLGHLPRLPSVKKVMAEVDVVSMCLAARRTTKLNGHLLPLCFVIVYYCCTCSYCCPLRLFLTAFYLVSYAAKKLASFKFN